MIDLDDGLTHLGRHWMRGLFMLRPSLADADERPDPSAISRGISKAGAENLGGNTDARKPGFINQQQRKGRADCALCDPGPAGHFRRKGSCDRRAAGEEGPIAAGIGCKGCGSTACRGAGKTPPRTRGFAQRKERG